MSYGTDVAQEAHDLLCTLARIPAPSHDEGRRAEFVRDWLIGQGLDAEIDDALNVTSSYGVGIIGRIALFSAHTDVVFPDTVPLPLVEQDGRIQAPGVGDDTANLVCLLLAYRELLRRIRTGELKRIPGAVERHGHRLDRTLHHVARGGLGRRVDDEVHWRRQPSAIKRTRHIPFQYLHASDSV